MLPGRGGGVSGEGLGDDVTSLELLKLEIGAQLVQIEDLLTPDYELTLIARNTKMDNADLVLSTDDLERVALALRKLINEPGRVIPGVDHPTPAQLGA